MNFESIDCYCVFEENNIANRSDENDRFIFNKDQTDTEARIDYSGRRLMMSNDLLNRKKTRLTTLSVWIPKDLNKRLNSYAADNKMFKKTIVRKVIEDFLKENES